MSVHICPRCGDPIDGERHGLSRLERAVICADCCTDEAVRDELGQPPIPPDEWAGLSEDGTP